MEVAAAFLAEYLVETVGPVDTHHSDHWEEDADAGAGRALEVKWREVFNRGPGITAFGEYQTVDSGGGLQHEGEVQLHTQAGVGITLAAPWCERTVFITAQGYGLGSRELEMELIRRYNEIAGAPDYDGGCGDYITVYSCNPEFTEGIIIVCGSIGVFNPSLIPCAGYIDFVE